MIVRKTNSAGTKPPPPSSPELSFQQCCSIVLRECPDEYAKAYANAGLIREEMQMSGYIEAQCLYILSNMEGWQGNNAKIVRDNLKRISKGR